MSAPADNAKVTKARTYISQLDLGHHRTTMAHGYGLAAPDLSPTPGSKDAWVDDGSVVSFVAGVSAEHKKDILHSALLAQLAANKRCDRDKDPIKWYDAYREVLEHIGWVLPQAGFQEFQSGGAKFTIDEVVVQILGAVATQNEIAVIKSTLDALKTLADKDHRITIFDRSSHSISHGNFQISTAVESNGSVAMRIGCFYFKSTETVTNILFFHFDKNKTDLHAKVQTADLDDGLYGQVRTQVAEKLGELVRKYVADIQI